jgi:uncharacterized protein YfaS (alpha-2-macroglobulin family)
VICQQLGYEIDRRVLARTSAWLFVWVGRNNPEPFVRAWVLDALAYAKPLDQGMLDRCVQDAQRSTGYARALTARALLNSGKTGAARAMYDTLLAQSGARRGIPAPSGRGADWAGDPVEEAAVLLELGLRLNADAAVLEELAVYLLGQRRGPAWNNSRDTAMAVLALAEYQSRFRERNQQITLSWAVNGARWTADQRVEHTDSGVINPDASLLRAGRNEINVRVAARDTVFLSADAGYFDLSPRFEAADLDGASVRRSFYHFGGQTGGRTRTFTAMPRTVFQTGDLVMVEVALSGFDGRYYMLEDPLPPGFSLERNDREFYSTRYPKEYADKAGRDDRTVFFLPGLSAKEPTVVRYFLRANLPGDYRWLPAQNGSMYNTTARARSGEQRVTVEAE